MLPFSKSKRKFRLRSSGESFTYGLGKNGVKIVHADELDMNTLQTSGMTRAADKEAKYGDRISEVLTSVKR